MMWYKIIGEYVELRVFAKPNAKRSEITGIGEQGLGVTLCAQPKEGAANTALVAFLSEYFDIPKSKICLLRGETSRRKVVKLPLTKAVKDFIAAT